jgi:anti-sigma factor RsiW
VKDHTYDESSPLDCVGCADLLQDYVDGSLPREVSLRVFLHVRECAACEAGLAHWQSLVQTLGQLPRMAPPADFDQRILAAVPYAAYRELAPLRQDRVPVYLQESFLPAAVRTGAVRLGGLALAAGCGLAVAAGQLPPVAMVGVGLGVLPETLVRLQDLGRRVALGLRRSEGGS